MPSNSDADMFAELRKIDTPSITNVVATYPTNPVCLGLYNPWSENWYTDTSIRCMYPELGAVAGYAVTCVYSVPDPNYNRLTFMDVIDALDASPKPTILVLQQKFPPELAAKAGLAGEIMVTSMQAVGISSSWSPMAVTQHRSHPGAAIPSAQPASAGHSGIVQVGQRTVTVGGIDVRRRDRPHRENRHQPRRQDQADTGQRQRC